MKPTADERMAILIAKLPENIGQAVDVAASYSPNAAHHTQWVVDQMLRHILGTELYQEFVDAFEAPQGQKGDRWITEWDTGIAP